MTNLLHKASTSKQIAQHARGYALLILECMMLPDTLGNRVSLHLLRPLKDLDRARHYS